MSTLLQTLRHFQQKQQGDSPHLITADAERLGCPPLDADMLRDGERGLWDLWPEEQERQESEDQVRSMAQGMARDPRGDIQKHVPVCIDFGTSSTVVALRENGSRRLLRAGITDWNQPAEASHFENPTVLRSPMPSLLAGTGKASHGARTFLHASSNLLIRPVRNAVLGFQLLAVRYVLQHQDVGFSGKDPGKDIGIGPAEPGFRSLFL